MTSIKDADTLIYHYGDSSVPPPYHRSYRITLTQRSANLLVDSYGDVVAREDIPVEPGLLNSLALMIHDGQIYNCQLAEDQACSGGTTESVRLMAGADILFKGSIYHCGGKGIGDLCGAIDALASRLKAVFCYFDDNGC